MLPIAGNESRDVCCAGAGKDKIVISVTANLLWRIRRSRDGGDRDLPQEGIDFTPAILLEAQLSAKYPLQLHKHRHEQDKLKIPINRLINDAAGRTCRDESRN